jgi:hypothetical protein
MVYFIKLRLKIVGAGKQPNFKIFSGIDFAAIYLNRAIGNAHNKAPLYQTLEIQLIGHFFGCGQYLAKELYISCSQRSAAAAIAIPYKKEANELPKGIQTQTARHNGIAFKMTVKEPEVRSYIDFGDNLSEAMLAAIIVDLNNSVDHQHIGGWEFSVAWAKYFAAAAGQYFFFRVRGFWGEGHVFLESWCEARIVPSYAPCGNH